MAYFVGTSGFSYKAWKGHFYPRDLADRDMLGYYGHRFNAVEINNTFYRMPRRSVLRDWAETVPEDFRFVIKASRRITHFKRLKEAGEPMAYLIANTAELGSRLGALLFQLPPSLRCDLERLKVFVDLIPEDARAAFEFRHASWFTDAVFECLRGRNIAICHADGEGASLPLVPTADWGYLRLRKPAYSKADLDGWLEQIRASQWRNTYVFFKHEEEGAGPRMAGSFRIQAEE